MLITKVFLLILLATGKISMIAEPDLSTCIAVADDLNHIPGVHGVCVVHMGEKK